MPGRLSGGAVHAISFDLDGTLCDHAGAVERAWAQVLRTAGEHGWVADREEARRRFSRAGAVLKDRADQAGQPEWSVAEQLAMTFDAHDRIPDGGIEELAAVFGGIIARPVGYPDALAALDWATRRGPVVIVTNGAHDRQAAKLAALGAPGLIESMVSSEQAGTAKPDPAIFLAACRRVGVAPNRVLHVGDDARHDIQGAARAGLRTCHLQRIVGPLLPGSIRTLVQLPEYLVF